MFSRKLQLLTQIVGSMTLVLLALYGLLALLEGNATSSWATEEIANITGGAQKAPLSQWGDSTVPLVMNYSGYADDHEGKPRTGYYTMTFRIYDDVIATTTLWQEKHINVTVREGDFSVLLGNNTPLTNTLFTDPDRFIGVTVHPYNEMIPRQRFASVPYAMHSYHATKADLLSGQSARVLMPPGTIVGYGGETPPDGWLLCDGSEVSRSKYPELFAAIGTLHGEGDGQTTFNLPDYRGRFLRGVDGGVGRDPDANSRTASNLGGNSGDAVGSVQGSATGRPNTPFTTDTTGEHFHQTPTLDGLSGSYEVAAGRYGYDYGDQSPPTTSDGNHSHTITSGGDNETRPINSYVNFMIKQ